MPIAAVPDYLGNDFKDASPGMRFGFFLPIWTTRHDQEADVRKRAEARSREGQDVADMLKRQGMESTISALRNRDRNRLPGLWDKNDFAARKAWESIKAFNKNDRDRMKALAERQTSLTATVPNDSFLHLYASAISPFTTGLGNEHPLENGFAFLNPYGLPYLPGSGVKGVLRQAARELASGEWGKTHGWDEKLPHPKSLSRGERDLKRPLPSGESETSEPKLGEGEGLSVIDVLFGLESENGEAEHLRGVLSFWDVIPQIEGDSLMVEIMTPHQSHYYQQKPQAGSISPHESGQPTPISFLTVPPGSAFTFHVVCDLAHLRHLAPELAENRRWKTLIRAAFEHAFAWLGFGAKTAVGYGAMRPDLEAEARAVKELAERESEVQRQAANAAREAALAAMTPNMQEIERLREEIDSRLASGRKLLVSDQFWGGRIKKLAIAVAESPDWAPDEKIALADMLQDHAGRLMSLDAKEIRKQLKLSVLRGLV